jgi:three-Cys-motif partner protein
MDTKGFIAEHSKAKLELYSRYLRAYLGVMLNTPKFGRIVVHDIFAGQGFSANAEKGSAIIAAEVIRELGATRNPRRKPISLNLNDADPKNVQQLKTHLKDHAFIQFHNVSADTYVDNLARNHGQHSLFFIDPYGYTQVSHDNLRTLFSQLFSDLLLFVPLYHIYRFLRHGEQSEQMKPIAQFLSNFGVAESSAKGTESPEEFAEVVKAAIAALSRKNWVNKQILKKRGHNSSYCLFFLTDSILGAERFLDAKDGTQSDEDESQMGFEFVEEVEQETRFQPFRAALQRGYVYDNVQLYELGIRHDLRPTDVNEVLKIMEELERVKVTNVVGAKPRTRKSFYIGYKYYKNSERRIAISKK